MRIEAKHSGGMSFSTRIGQHSFTMDAKPPIGRDTGASPKELLLAAIAGCSGMDVAALLRKYRMTPSSFTIDCEATPRDEHPRIFPRIDLRFVIIGEGLDLEKIKEAVTLSLTKYCGVSAMVADTSPIFYKIVVNDSEIAKGQAQF